MPLLNLNAVDGALRPVGGGGLGPALRAALAGVESGAPVLVMIHGFRFSPAAPGTDPHSHILALSPRTDDRRAVSWPRHMGFGRGVAAEGLCIGFGWEARGTIWQAWREAARAADLLASLVTRLRAQHPGPVDILAHSLGARVALRAMARLSGGAIGRVILMAAAEYRSAAADAQRGGAEVINVTSRENDLFDGLVEWLIRKPARGDRTLGRGLQGHAPNWLDVQVDCVQARVALAGFGYRIPPPVRRICHWSAYLRPGLFGFYRDLIRDRDGLPLAELSDALPKRTAPSARRGAHQALAGLPR
ncbi:MAG: alpha/beta fold hydrolase [Rhodobacteraceae bacterium]|nr:alpha/beta fold hydrolase [Paracoccaceae bacterium]